MRNCARGQTVLTLIQERTRFLTALRSHEKADAVLDDLQLLGGLPVKRAGHHPKSFQKSYLYVISFNHSARSEFLDQQFDQLRLNCLRALRESLDHKDIVVAVNDE